jgi:hypothetical protein
MNHERHRCGTQRKTAASKDRGHLWSFPKQQNLLSSPPRPLKFHPRIKGKKSPSTHVPLRAAPWQRDTGCKLGTRLCRPRQPCMQQRRLHAALPKFRQRARPEKTPHAISNRKRPAASDFPVHTRQITLRAGRLRKHFHYFKKLLRHRRIFRKSLRHRQRSQINLRAPRLFNRDSGSWLRPLVRRAIL